MKGTDPSLFTRGVTSPIPSRDKGLYTVTIVEGKAYICP